jgi:putative ABC transport system substrate-binding protein
MFSNRRNRFIGLGLLVVVVLVIGGVLLLSQQNDDKKNDKTYKVGIVNSAAIMSTAIDGFKQDLTTLGYTEGKNITYLYNGPTAKEDLEAEIQRLIDEKVDVIFTLTTNPTVKAKEMTAASGLPVVFAPVTDPIGAGIVTDLNKPGGNITGIISGLSENRRLEWLKTVAPDVQRVFIPYNPDDPSPVKTLDGLQATAEKIGVELVLLETPDKAAVEAAIANVPEDVDAIFLPSDTLVGSYVADWVAKSIELKIPTSGSSQAHVTAGVMCSYSYSPFQAGQLAADLVDHVLQGATPGELPIETAEPQASINLATANAIGLEIPDATLQQASIVIRE